MSSTDKVILTCLQVLAERESWRANDLPQGCTLNVLRVLDHDGLIQFRVWERGEPNPQPFVNPDPTKMVVRPQKYSTWFSPSQTPGYGGNLGDVLAKGEDDPELAPGIKLSERGRAKLAELEIAALAEEPQGSAKQAASTSAGKAGVGTDPAGEDDQVDPPESPSRNNELQPTDIFRRDGRDWFVKHCGQEALYTHVEGFAICYDLLQRPHSLIEAQELPSTRKADGQVENFGADEVIDERTEDELKESAEIFADEVSQARRQGDEALAEQKLGELRWIQKTLKSAKNIRGKRRTLSSTTSEKHRKRVLAALKLAYQKLRDKGMGELADHLDGYVDVDGGSYIYRPAKPIDWRFE